VVLVLRLLIDDLGGVECCASCTFVSDQQKVIFFTFIILNMYTGSFFTEFNIFILIGSPASFE